MKKAKKIFNENYRTYSTSIIVLLIGLLSSNAASQKMHKKNITENDYLLWSTLKLEEIDDKEEWISFKKFYQNTDTLFVRNIKTKKTFQFANASAGNFKSNYFICSKADSIISILSLKTGKVKEIRNAQLSEAYDKFIVINKSSNSKKSTVFINYDGAAVFTVEDIVEYAVSPDQKWIAAVLKDDQENAIVIQNTLDHSIKNIMHLPLTQGIFKNLSWSKNNNALAFFESNKVRSKVNYYNRLQDTIKFFSTTDATVPNTMDIYTSRKIKISDDGTKVFFHIRQKQAYDVIRKPDDVQVWRSRDKIIYPAAKETEGFTQNPKYAMWEPITESFLQITDVGQPFGGSAGNDNFAITFNPLDYEPQSKIVPDSDYYVKDYSSGNNTLIARQLAGGGANIIASPLGKHIAYFAKGHWYMYTVTTGITINLSARLNTSFSVESLTEKDEIPYGSPGWTKDDTHIILHDQFDVWKVRIDGSKSERLTKGREHNTIYRLIATKDEQQEKYERRITTAGTFDETLDWLLVTQSLTNDYNGFSVWSKTSGLKEICYVRKNINDYIQSKNGLLVWTEEDVKHPPIVMKQSNNGKAIKLWESNLQHKKFNWTRQELINYQIKSGAFLNGILLYPADYVQGEKYPMVVHIYEKQSQFIHRYTNPTLLNGDGFNSTNLTGKGYFVFLPDITYRAGEIGNSAVDCVERAVKKVLEKTAIDKDRVGLIGHSFGGTQTAFIITQSKLFKCAIAGAATTNFLSSYLSITPNYNIPNFFKIEMGQARMIVSPFENMEIYLQNSAIMQAEKITTPLLSWTGLKDGQVDPAQSFQLYLALRKLNSDHVMLVYPDVGHDTSGRQEAADLTKKTEEWFDYYLKGSKRPTWL